MKGLLKGVLASPLVLSAAEGDACVLLVEGAEISHNNSDNSYSAPCRMWDRG